MIGCRAVLTYNGNGAKRPPLLVRTVRLLVPGTDYEHDEYSIISTRTATVSVTARKLHRHGEPKLPN